jgi:hypothetical protein
MRFVARRSGAPPDRDKGVAAESLSHKTLDPSRASTTGEGRSAASAFHAKRCEKEIPRVDSSEIAAVQDGSRPLRPPVQRWRRLEKLASVDQGSGVERSGDFGNEGLADNAFVSTPGLALGRRHSIGAMKSAPRRVGSFEQPQQRPTCLGA